MTFIVYRTKKLQQEIITKELSCYQVSLSLGNLDKTWYDPARLKLGEHSQEGQILLSEKLCLVLGLVQARSFNLIT